MTRPARAYLDQESADTASRLKPPPGRFDPKCCSPGCRRDGLLGRGAVLRKEIDGTWWCAEHAPADLRNGRAS